MVRKRVFTEEDLKRLPALPDGYEWIIFYKEPCISGVDEEYMAWVTSQFDEEDKYHWVYHPSDARLRIRYSEPVSFNDAINAIVNLVWLNHISTP